MKIKRLAIGLSVVFMGLPLMMVIVGLAYVWIADLTSRHLTSSGEKRTYLVHVPAGYDSVAATPLVISLHGAMGWPGYHMKISQWNRASEEHGFIVAYPGGTGLVLKSWLMEGANEPARMPDVRFISDLIDTLEATYAIDPRRIYVNGMSNGGGMAFVLSCALSDRIAAIGTVSAAQSLPWSWCASPEPLPMIAFHGTGDPIVPFEGGTVAMVPEPFPSVRSWAESWAERNGCGGGPVEAAAAPNVLKVEYTECVDDAAVVLYVVSGAGHQWPGGEPFPEWFAGPMTDDISATDVMWAFFRDHPLRRE